LLRLLETIRSRSNRLRINKYDDFIWSGPEIGCQL
jgi:hypothetical protein